MPALDPLVANGAIHIADQNKLKPVKTLCGQALDKESTKYLLSKENFNHASCKVCRSIYFDETWNGEIRQEIPSEPERAPITNLGEPAVRPLFGALQHPVNSHTKLEGMKDGS